MTRNILPAAAALIVLAAGAPAFAQIGAQTGDSLPEWTVCSTNNKSTFVEKAAACTKAINAGMSSDSRLSAAYYNRANAQFDQGYYYEALKDYDQALKLVPDFTRAVNERGRTYFALGDLKKAAADFDRAARIDPKFATPHIYKGELYFRRGEYQLANDAFERANKINSRVSVDSTMREQVRQLVQNGTRASGAQAEAIWAASGRPSKYPPLASPPGVPLPAAATAIPAAAPPAAGAPQPAIQAASASLVGQSYSPGKFSPRAAQKPATP